MKIILMTKVFLKKASDTVKSWMKIKNQLFCIGIPNFKMKCSVPSKV